MRIVLVNKFMWRRDGASAYVLELRRLLEEAGHEVALFGMREAQTISTPWEKYFIDEIHFDRSEGLWRDAKKVAHMIWSTEARRKFSQLLDDFKPDIVHLHVTYHQISPSILPECRRRNIPVVMTAHDYHLISPNYSLFTRGKPCWSCFGNSFWRTIAYNCLDNAPKSVAGALEHLAHRALRVYERNLARVICPSRFMEATLARGGFPAAKLVHVPNPVFTVSLGAPTLGSDVVYAGRLSSEKGVQILIEAARRLPAIPFVIVGDGPARKTLEREAARGAGNVRFLGFKQHAELVGIVGRARLVAVPSVWYENFPYAALEPMALGKTVIASRIGGIPEIIRDGETGVLVPSRDAGALADAISGNYHDLARLERLGAAAREAVIRTYDPVEHLARILDLYASLSR